MLDLNQTHYLRNVLRCVAGHPLLLFNGRDGEWHAVVSDMGKKGGLVTVERQTRTQTNPCDLWALFAPVKKDQTDFMVEKAGELGASVLQPVLTQRSNTQRINAERWQANVIEAAEQCERLDVPEIRPLKPLDEVLAAWPSERILFVCAERGRSTPALEAFKAHRGKPAAILTGPEGGFTESEFLEFDKCAFAVRISLGPRILRAETALISALSIYQSISEK